MRIISISLLCLALTGYNSKAQTQQLYREELVNQCRQLIATFTPLQQHLALRYFDDTARPKWNNLPVGLRARAGVSMGNLNEDQRKMVHRILSASLSSQGYLKASGIMHLDDLLNMFIDTAFDRKIITAETASFMRDLKWSNNNYYLAFFGKPSDEVWGYKLEGHHLSLNFTFSPGNIAVTPWFMGSDPAEMPFTSYAGWRVLGQEEDLGLMLVRMLTAQQQAKATQSGNVPGDVITGAETGKRLIEYWGLKAAEMTQLQQSVMLRIIKEYLFNLEPEKATEEYNKITEAGIENIFFGWIGPYEEKKPHYFLLNGPTFLIEFDNAGGPRQNANHIHTIWREKRNEYAEDVLKKHYQQEKH